MEKITSEELRKVFEKHYSCTYKTKSDFIKAVEAEYNIDENKTGEILFSHAYADEEPFFVSDWVKFQSKK
jgi:hypothetical protein